MLTDHFSQSGSTHPPLPRTALHIRTDTHTDWWWYYIKRVVHGPSGDHTLKNRSLCTNAPVWQVGPTTQNNASVMTVKAVLGKPGTRISLFVGTEPQDLKFEEKIRVASSTNTPRPTNVWVWQRPATDLVFRLTGWSIEHSALSKVRCQLTKLLRMAAKFLNSQNVGPGMSMTTSDSQR